MKRILLLALSFLLQLLVCYCVAIKEVSHSSITHSNTSDKRKDAKQERGSLMKGYFLNADSGAIDGAGGQDNNKKALEEAKNKLNTAKTDAQSIWDNAKSAKTTAASLNEAEVKQTEEAKNKAESTGNSVEKAKKYIENAKNAHTNAVSEASTANSKAIEAEEKAKKTFESIESSIKTVEDAEKLSETDKSDERKQVAEKAETDTTTLTNDANAAKALTEESTKAVGEVKKHLTEAQVALQQVKIIILAEKMNKIHDESTKNHTDVVALKHTAEQILNGIDGMKLVRTDGVEDEITKIHQTANELLKVINEKIDVIKSAMGEVQNQKKSTDDAVSKMDSLSDVSASQSSLSATENAVTAAEKEAEKSKTAIDEIRKNAQKIEIKGYEANATLSVAQVDELVKQAEGYAEDAVKKEIHATEFINQIKNLEKDANPSVKVQMTTILDATNTLMSTVTSEKGKATSAKEKAIPLKQTTRNALAEIQKEGKEVSDAKISAITSQEVVASATQEKKNAQFAFEKVSKAFDSLERKTYEAATIIAAYKADTQWKEAMRYLLTFSAHKTEAEKAVQSIQMTQKDLNSEIVEEVEKQRRAAEAAVEEMTKKETNLRSEVDNAKTKKENVDNALNDIKKESTSLSGAKTKSEDAVQKSNEAAIFSQNAKSILSSISALLNVSLKANHTAVAIVTVKEVVKNYERAETNLQRVKEGDGSNKDWMRKIREVEETSPTSAKAIIAKKREVQEKELSSLTENIAVTNATLQDAKVHVKTAESALLHAQTASSSFLDAQHVAHKATDAARRVQSSAEAVTSTLQSFTTAVQNTERLYHTVLIISSSERVTETVQMVTGNMNDAIKENEKVIGLFDNVMERTNRASFHAKSEIMKQMEIAKTALNKVPSIMTEIEKIMKKAEVCNTTAFSARQRATVDTQTDTKALENVAKETNSALLCAESEKQHITTKLLNVQKERQCAKDAINEALKVLETSKTDSLSGTSEHGASSEATNMQNEKNETDVPFVSSESSTNEDTVGNKNEERDNAHTRKKTEASLDLSKKEVPTNNSFYNSVSGLTYTSIILMLFIAFHVPILL